MLINNIRLTYSILTILYISKRSCEAMGRLIGISGDTIRRILPDCRETSSLLERIALWIFRDKKNLVFIIDDTLIHKSYSRYMQGSGYFYDTKMGRRILAFKLLLSGATDGTYFIPLMSAFLFSKDVCHEPNPSNDSLVKQMILRAITLFGDRITIATDGAFATKSLFAWCIDNVVRAELRMHSNRKVLYKGRTLAIRSIKELQPKGRHMSRTIKAIWHDMLIYITAQRRINQHGEETMVY